MKMHSLRGDQGARLLSLLEIWLAFLPDEAPECSWLLSAPSSSLKGSSLYPPLD